jgi:hypothetical protein
MIVTRLVPVKSGLVLLLLFLLLFVLASFFFCPDCSFIRVFSGRFNLFSVHLTEDDSTVCRKVKPRMQQSAKKKKKKKLLVTTLAKSFIYYKNRCKKKKKERERERKVVPLLSFLTLKINTVSESGIQILFQYFLFLHDTGFFLAQILDLRLQLLLLSFTIYKEKSPINKQILDLRKTHIR